MSLIYDYIINFACISDKIQKLKRNYEYKIIANMQTILHIIDTTGPGGAETVYITLADKIRAHGYDSIAVVRGPGWVHDELRRREVLAVVLDTSGRFNWHFLRALITLIRDKDIALIQSHLLGANVYSALAGWITGVPVIGTFHGRVDIHPDERFRRIKLWLMERGIRRFVAVSGNLAGIIERERLLNPAKTDIIYNGVDLQRYTNTRSRILREELSIPGNATIIGCLGNIRPAKAYDVLIRAIAALRDDFPELHVIIAGHQKPALMIELQRLMEDLDIASRFHFIGFHDDSAAFLSELDVFVLCSTSEGFSISTVEAMAAGLPVLATRCGGPEEIVTDGVDGMLVEAGSPQALAEGLKGLLTQPDLQQSLATVARQTATEKFSEQAMLQRYLELYKAALQKGV